MGIDASGVENVGGGGYTYTSQVVYLIKKISDRLYSGERIKQIDHEMVNFPQQSGSHQSWNLHKQC